MSVTSISFSLGANSRRLTAFWMLYTQFPHRYPPMCICTRFTCAAELTALPSNKSRPNIAVNVLRLIRFLPINFSYESVCVRSLERIAHRRVDTLRPWELSSSHRNDSPRDRAAHAL